MAGAAALLKAADPGLDFSKARKVLLDSAARLPSLKGKCASEGKLDVGAALKTVLRWRKNDTTVEEWLATIRRGRRLQR